MQEVDVRVNLEDNNDMPNNNDTTGDRPAVQDPVVGVASNLEDQSTRNDIIDVGLESDNSIDSQLLNGNAEDNLLGQDNGDFDPGGNGAGVPAPSLSLLSLGASSTSRPDSTNYWVRPAKRC